MNKKYTNEGEDNQEKLRKSFRNISSDWGLVSVNIHISEDANTLHEERPTYKQTNLLSGKGHIHVCLV